MKNNDEVFAGTASDVSVEVFTNATPAFFKGNDTPPVTDPERGNEDPKKRPEVEPERLPKEDPGEPKKKPDDDDDYTPYEEPEIGDDPEHERIKLPIM